MKKSLIILGLVVLCLGGYFIYQNTTKIKSPNQEVKIEDIIYTDKIYVFTQDDKEITAQYSTDGDWVKINYEGEQYELPNVVSASGAKYANEDETVVFWQHQEKAIFELNGETVFNEEDSLLKTQVNENDILTTPNLSLEETKWQWKETVYTDGNLIIPNQSEEFVLYFMKEGRFSSLTDCNNIMGSFKITEDNLIFDHIASTKKACLDGEIQEEIYTAMLTEADKVKINETTGDLEIKLKESKGTIFFTHVAE